MHELAKRHLGSNGLLGRALQQAARELLLAESSDWAFIMKTGTNISYATERLRNHIVNFTKLYEQIKEGQIDEGFLRHLESRHNVFPDVDWAVFA